MSKRILVVAAHPDDEILGCGGTIAKMVKQGAKVTTVILGEGKTSRDESRNREKREGEIKVLNSEVVKANKIIGVNDVILESLPDNRFDSVALLDVVKIIENIKKKIKPDTIFTHYENDCNVDHRVTYNAVMTATRPMVGETVKSIYSFEVMSSTEWRFPIVFSPNTFIDISKTLETKIKSMAAYKSELCDYPHPRSLKGIELTAEVWGMKTGLKYAEAFQLIRHLG